MDSEPHSRQKPTGSGIRSAKFGLRAIVLSSVLTAVVIAAVTYAIVGGNQATPPPVPPPPTTPPAAPDNPEPPKVPDKPDPIPDPNPDPQPPVATVTPPERPPETTTPDPEIDPNHPLIGKKHIVLATPGRGRHGYLTFTGNLADGIHYPLATVEADDACVWELVGEKDYKDVYRIICRTPDSEGHWAGAELSYTQLDDNDLPNATLEKNDPLAWEILPVPDYQNRYTIQCFRTDFDGHRLSPLEDHAYDEKAPYPLAVLREVSEAAWLILPEEAPLPQPPERVNHVIIFPREDIAEGERKELDSWLEGINKHLAADPGCIILHLKLSSSSKLAAEHSGFPFGVARTQLEAQRDPATEFLPGALGGSRLGAIASEIENDPRTLSPFPLVIPLKDGGEKSIDITTIDSLKLEDDDAYIYDKLESIDDLQSKLEDRPDRPDSHGRVYHGNKFTYVFVRLKNVPPPAGDDAE